ncbi:50S ribosomal protein L40e [Candidatus Woesearchaeota archaeon]|nr:50S ribosomal protein L40e [Candidatus Woesearchaeota archaeon]
MVKFPEANARLFKNIFVCRRCKRKTRIPNRKVLSGKASCRKCSGRALRPVRKK